jgi:hypothetical protein
MIGWEGAAMRRCPMTLRIKVDGEWTMMENFQKFWCTVIVIAKF